MNDTMARMVDSPMYQPPATNILIEKRKKSTPVPTHRCVIKGVDMSRYVWNIYKFVRGRTLPSWPWFQCAYLIQFAGLRAHSGERGIWFLRVHLAVAELISGGVSTGSEDGDRETEFRVMKVMFLIPGSMMRDITAGCC
jgi:hypothetical protein